MSFRRQWVEWEEVAVQTMFWNNQKNQKYSFLLLGAKGVDAKTFESYLFPKPGTDKILALFYYNSCIFSRVFV